MSDDLISRRAAVDALIAQANHEGAYGYIDAKEAEDVLMALPTVDVPDRKVGKWECSDDIFEYALCSCCKWDSGEAWEYALKRFRFCPNCGARMKGEDDAEVH